MVRRGTSGGGSDRKAERLDDPSGWLYLTHTQSLSLLVETILDMGAGTEFVKADLIRQSGLTKATVNRRFDRLVEAGLIEVVDPGRSTTYRVRDGPAFTAVRDLRRAVDRARRDDWSVETRGEKVADE
ncbi:hypothetical protein BRD17_01475 [Halobacteriales archaeon SW_7_68_16]|nr:MAG: hypothetical protein BRD17_01475 [Halobacteriales archaeon SW_7_68_16]